MLLLSLVCLISVSTCFVFEGFLYLYFKGWAWWFTSVIPATQKAEEGGLWSKGGGLGQRA
jgi:hypothetical protein